MTRIPCKKAVAALAAVTLGLALTACSGGGTDSGDTPANSVSVWFPGIDEAEMKLVNETLVPKFEQQTGAQVEVTFVDWENVSPKLNAAFAAGTAPDVLGHGIAATADFVHNDRIADLTPYVEKLSQGDRDDLANALPGGQVDGKQYFVPLIMALRLVAYSGADFKAAGLNPDQPPKTWEQVRATAEKLTQRNGDKITRSGLVVSNAPISGQQTFGTLLWANGGELLTEDNSKAALTAPEAVEALTFYTGLYQGGNAVDGQLGTNWAGLPPAQQPIATGTASMQLADVSGIEKLQKAAPQRDIRVMPPLAFEGNEPASFGGPANGLMLNKDSKNPDLAWKFIEHMMSAEVSTQYATSLGFLPIRKSAMESEAIKTSAVKTTALKALDYARPNPNVPGWVRARDAIDKSLEQALRGKLSPEEALKQAAAEVDKTLEANR
ncbi:ABC transporter substrate-binding protein [Kribbella shirazensis]|uniref:Multiple sugar transport system substrate-binding protein n=1 Tax=Kribbella shirazensis TaxID=1105143 RepID=A0A7X5V4Y4_9ACTN|nr:ABC transporter substrate-binding protein [Kribbella shirazensis]NIK54703.1 multiple sugar transport system substrate-binding protein [Kribbella shirazensis]